MYFLLLITSQQLELRDRGIKVVALTAQGKGGTTFVSRFFAPALGVAEDPVTGSLQCLLAPYWSKKLGIKPGEAMRVQQVGPRTGELEVIWNEADEVCLLRGSGRIVCKGVLHI
jgi:predicted PhzF superfamily epimerase YddE/YHI9